MSRKEYIDGSVAFTPEEVEAKEHIELLNFLVKRGAEIRIWTDGYCTIVEWIDRVMTEEGYVFAPVAQTEDELRKTFDLPERDW